ncbi:DUF727 domain-containing protein [Aphelenchoides fujianensis]|nr:DUF727 domain-containing protein [Aphelenchoides fujianensis]
MAGESTTIPEFAQLAAEIAAAESELKPFVRLFARSASLPQGPAVFYANLRTLEDRTACIELTVRGWRVVSDRFDSTGDGHPPADWPQRHFETMQQLLSEVSAGYRLQFASSLSSALADLQKEREAESGSD